MAECIICRDDEDTIKNNDEIVIKCNECDNISCKKCIEEYLSQTSRMYPHCPNCNKYIDIPNIKKEVLEKLISNMIEYDFANNLHETSEKEKLKKQLKECND
jgi:disulfide oxidoreductase YuzD